MSVPIENVTSRYMSIKLSNTLIDIRDPGMIYSARLTLWELDTLVGTGRRQVSDGWICQLSFINERSGRKDSANSHGNPCIIIQNSCVSLPERQYSKGKEKHSFYRKCSSPASFMHKPTKPTNQTNKVQHTGLEFPQTCLG